MSELVVGRLRGEVIDILKQQFVERDEVVDLIALALVAGEHLFLYGPPGTAKSAFIRQFASAVRGRYFEYLLTRFTEPSEIIGAIDISELRDGRYVRRKEGKLPTAKIAFLDEIFKSNSAILNILLTIINEKKFYREGKPGESDDTKRKAFGRVVDDLLAKGFIGSQDGFVWPIERGS